MIVYLAAFKTIKDVYDKPVDDTYLLTSFYEFQKSKKLPDYLYQEKHILDSGAFSMFASSKTHDYDDYCAKYIAFIKETKSKLYFEMDIDKITSLAYAEELRERLTQETGIQPIPVWHKTRGVDYWHRMCEEFNYIAIGASGSGPDSAWTRTPEGLAVLQKMVKIARNNNCKVHGLGFTKIPALHKIRFHSVDSTTWVNGGRFGTIIRFAKDYKSASQRKPKNSRVKNASDLCIYNFDQWVRFQRFAERNL